MTWASELPATWENDVTATVFRYLVMLLLLLPVTVVQAQQQTGDAEPSAQQAGDSSDDDSAAQDPDDSDSGAGGNADSDSDVPDIDSQPIESSQSTGPGRFIPSEQISQDFGVSFPVDI